MLACFSICLRIYFEHIHFTFRQLLSRILRGTTQEHSERFVASATVQLVCFAASQASLRVYLNKAQSVYALCEFIRVCVCVTTVTNKKIPPNHLNVPISSIKSL